MTAREYVENVAMMMRGRQKDPWEKFVSAGDAFEEVNWRVSRSLAREFRCKTRQCFLNCGVIAYARLDLRYYEGYALNMIPVEHAWLVNGEDEVLDPTWSLRKTDKVGDYFGIEIPLKYLIRRRQRRVDFEPRWAKVLRSL